MKPLHMKKAVLMTTLMTTLLLTMKKTETVMQMKLASWTSNVMTMTVVMDWMSKTFLTTVMTITTAITVYSMFYMKEEKKKKEFTIIKILFVTSMLMMVVSPNTVSIMVGWDGLGLSSFFLVTFYQNENALKSGLITMYSNRAGDAAMILMISNTMEKLWKEMSNMNLSMSMMMAAAVTKSAQVPFSAWLPAAMAAPTPISSLVHSSTLVTAGVWMMSRFKGMTKSSAMKKIMMMMATTTTIMAGMTAWKEKDTKKIVAMSTLSQLGMMMMMTSMKLVKVAFMHMNVHALFKASLFMATGITMSKFEGAQSKKDLSAENNMESKPMMQMAMINMMGLPVTTGFMSKDLMLETNMEKMKTTEMFLLMTTATLTMIYSMEMMKKLTMKKKKKTNKAVESNKSSTIMMTALTPVALTISAMQEINTMQTKTTEKSMWLFMLTVAMLSSSKKKEMKEKKETMTAKVWTSAETVSKLKKSSKESKTDKMWTTFMTKSMTKMLEKKKKTNKTMKMNMTIMTIITVIFMMK